MAALEDPPITGRLGARRAPRGRGGAAPIIARQTTPELLACAQAGDERAFEELYARYHRRVLVHAEALLDDRHEAENVAHDVLMASWRALPSFDAGQTPFFAWLHTTTKNIAFMHHRKHVGVSVLDAPALAELHERLDTAATGGAPVDSSLGELQRQVSVLPQRQRRVLELRYGGDLSFDQIAELMECGEAAARQAHHRAIGTLRRRFARRAPERRDALPMRALAWPVRGARPSGFSLRPAWVS